MSGLTMRLAVFTNQFPSRTCSFFARDLRGLIDAGIEIDVFPFYPPAPALWDAVPELLNARVFPRDRIHYIPLRAAAAWPRSTQRRRLPQLLRDTTAVLRSATRFGVEATGKSLYVALKAWAWAERFPAGRFDHILAYWGNYSATAAYLYHRLTDSSIPFSLIAHARMDLYEKQTYLAEKMLYADNVFLVCEYNRGYLARLFPDVWRRLEPKVRIHHLGLDLDEFAVSTEPRRTDRIVTVGRLEQLKGVHILLEAVQCLASRGLRPELEIVGGGEEAAALAALADRLGIRSQVTFRGWVAPAQVIRAMRGAAMLVHPSIRPDAMPTVLKEAIALGTPVIASDLAGIPEILDGGRCGTLVPPGDAGALADAIERLLADAGLRQSYAAAGRSHAERTFDLWSNARILASRLRDTPARTRSHLEVPR